LDAHPAQLAYSVSRISFPVGCVSMSVGLMRAPVLRDGDARETPRRLEQEYHDKTDKTNR
jgi:hypothetical protein